jgi:hypothetical protein
MEAEQAPKLLASFPRVVTEAVNQEGGHVTWLFTRLDQLPKKPVDEQSVVHGVERVTRIRHLPITEASSPAAQPFERFVCALNQPAAIRSESSRWTSNCPFTECSFL